MSVAEPGSPTAAAATGAIGVTADTGVADVAAARPLRGEIWRRFRRNKLAAGALTFLVLLVLVAIFAPLVAPYGITDRTGEFRAGPSWDHLFGTDRIGRDVFSRVVYGARVSLRVGILATGISLVFGGFRESVIMRITDVFLSIPYIILAIAIATVLGRGENTVIIVLGVTGWLAICRIVRSSFLQLRQLEYVEAATAIGAGRARIMFRHILPNALQPVIVYGAIAVGTAILSEAALSFLGVGAVEPTPAWGLMINEGRGDLVNAPHLLFFPGGAIFLTVLAFQFVGDGLRDALDPRLK
jgi:ABC-type dipeptide/oligopeptide/nickel transport system permease subunit